MQKKPVILFVEPQLPENIGMAARAMVNFDLSDLRLVNPREEFPNERAFSTAGHAKHLINKTKIFSSLSSAISDLHFIFAATARKRDGFKTVRSPAEAIKILYDRICLGQNVGILFGRERCGLLNDEIMLADEIVTFPTVPEFSSLNIAQSVLLMAYEWMRLIKGDQSLINDCNESKKKPASREQLHFFLQHLQSSLENRGYFRTIEKKKRSIEDLFSVFIGAGFSALELQLLQGVLSCLDYFSPSFPRGAGYPERKKKTDMQAHHQHASNIRKIKKNIILLFDSGIGGLTILHETRLLMPDYRFIYVADDAAFPYGTQNQETLNKRIVWLIGDFIQKYNPSIIVIACNTASTLSLMELRKTYPEISFIGTVPGIKPAAERTRSSLFSVLGTPNTIQKEYTQNLITQWAPQSLVQLVGNANLARMVETWITDKIIDQDVLKKEIEPCFVEKDGARTDIVVLACTHYPFLVHHMRKVAPWPVDWLDTGEAIARRVLFLVNQLGISSSFSQDDGLENIAIFTSSNPSKGIQKFVKGFGLTIKNEKKFCFFV